MNLSITLGKAMKRLDLTPTELGRMIHLSGQAVSNYKTAYRHISVQKAKEMQDVLHDVHFGNHAAAEYFGTLLERTTKDLSHPEDSFLIRELRDNEELERQQLDDKAYKIFMIPYQKRTMSQNEVTERYLKEFAEEMAVEMLSFFKACEEAQMDPYDILQEVNKQNEE
ncbi:helix-turn-helix transcriptional regulator [Ligilactobacillus sp. WILCCON 0076]|uniref:Helix-turn-helix transcriptional regulator n=1 Tax=Ligilactobacillus ubinensis TaxID=2876789 RepID=A0A9X2FJV0_9LACO|nr:helix-turn-helix transcriptional regulator [Ligilactobacillus ubinensis]MCP0886961.1 helix-turn-helix transcriptional regulator [Ligilactobacillus ubinensis]